MGLRKRRSGNDGRLPGYRDRRQAQALRHQTRPCLVLQKELQRHRRTHFQRPSCAQKDVMKLQPSKSVLDVCCGSRMFWFKAEDDRAIFLDNRNETHTVRDSSTRAGLRTIRVAPDQIADFTALPFESEQFSLVVFDPPHLTRAGKNGWQAKKYGKLEGNWKTMLSRGFSECFRVLRPEGTLIFKWNEYQVPVSQIISLSPVTPLIGQRCGKSAKTHWMVFLKPSTP